MRNFIKKHQSLIMEILRFLLVGGLATLVDFGVFELCMYCIFKNLSSPSDLIISTSLGFLIGNIINYILSIVFVYKGAKDDKETQTIKAFLIFTLIGVVGLGIKVGVQVGGNYLVDSIFTTNNAFWLWVLETFVYCVATLIVLIWNYIGRKIFIFKNKNETITINNDEDNQI